MDYKKKLTAGQGAQVDELAQQLIAEEKSLREVRKALGCSQADLAKKLGMNQGDLSKFERRTDVYLSTVRHYVEALGGTLDLIATFPETGSVKIVNFEDALVLDEEEPQALK